MINDGSLRTVARALLLAVLVTGTFACSSGMDELQQQIDVAKKKPGGRIEPLPEIKPYETFAYDASSVRSPFVPGAPAASSNAGLRPDARRNREFLEQFSLDTLKMVGTLDLGGHNYGLVQTKDGLVHRVLPGNYLGQNDGRILSITSSKINLTEIVPDGAGGYIERPAQLALAN